MDGSGPGEITGGPEAAGEVVACAERTLAASSARIEVQLRTRPPPGWQPPDAGQLGASQPGIGFFIFHALMRVLGALLYPISRITSPGRWPTGPLFGEGFIEPARARYMIDNGRYASVFADGKLAFGGPGRRVRKPVQQPVEIWPVQVLWLLRLLPSVTDARPEGSETLHGTVCQKLAAHVDVARASAASPEVGRYYEGLTVLPVTVWIDGQHVRRIEFQQPASPSLRQHARGSESQQYFTPALLTLELWEFGVPVGGLDWSRLPTFRSRGHA